MANEKYQVLTAPKTDGVSLEEARVALAAEYPAYKVEVFDSGDEFVAKLARKTAAPGGKVPPFLDEEEDAPKDEAPEDDAPEDEAEAPEGSPEDEAEDKAEGEPEDSKEDKDDEGKDKDDKEGGDLGKALKALDTLKSVLPKLETQLKELNGGELPGGLGEGPLGPEGLEGAPPHGAPPGAGVPPGPSPHDLEAIGPTPGKPGPGGPVLPGLGGPRPPRPGVGVPTFGNVKRNKFVYRPAVDDNGEKISMAEAASEIAAHPRYASYDVQEVKLDETGSQYIAHLKLKE